MTPAKPKITGTTHLLPFDKLSEDDFERLCLWLVEREGFHSAEALGASGSEQGRDIVAWREQEQLAFQCKRVKQFGFRTAEEEIEKILKLPEDLQPVKYVFLVSINVSDKTRRQVRAAYPKPEIHFWAGTELDEKVKRHPQIVREFFQLPGGEPEYKPVTLPEIIDDLKDLNGLPPGSRMPFARNAVFTGREKDLIELAKCLLYGGQRAVGITQAAAATGAGGIGKTQLAVEFCYRYGRYFHGVHWMQANQDMMAEIAACGAEMGLQPWPETLPEQVQATLQAWERGGLRLVVLDNVEDPGVVQAWLPQLSQARLLATSRRREWPADLGWRCSRWRRCPARRAWRFCASWRRG